MQSSHVNQKGVGMTVAFLRESQQTQRSGLNLGAGRALSCLLSSSTHTACSLLASWSSVMPLVFLALQNLQRIWHSALAVPFCCRYPLLSLSSSYLIFLFCQRCPCSLRACALGNSSTHSCRHPTPVQPLLLHIRISGLRLLTVPSANLQCAWLRGGEPCGGPRLCSLIYTLFFLGSHSTAASSWWDRRRLQLRGQARGPFGFGFLSPATAPHLARVGLNETSV